MLYPLRLLALKMLVMAHSLGGVLREMVFTERICKKEKKIHGVKILKGVALSTEGQFQWGVDLES